MLVQFQPPQLARDKLGSSSIVERVVSGSRPKTGQRGHSLRQHTNTQASFGAMELTAPGGKATSAGGFCLMELEIHWSCFNFFELLASRPEILLPHNRIQRKNRIAEVGDELALIGTKILLPSPRSKRTLSPIFPTAYAASPTLHLSAKIRKI